MTSVRVPCATGCGTPVELAALQPGETVVDLGAGAGFDVLLAAKAVGPAGKAYGVDMVPAMLAKARAAAKAAVVSNAAYLLGEIEHLPLPDASCDVVRRRPPKPASWPVTYTRAHTHRRTHTHTHAHTRTHTLLL